MQPALESGAAGVVAIPGVIFFWLNTPSYPPGKRVCSNRYRGFERISSIAVRVALLDLAERGRTQVFVTNFSRPLRGGRRLALREVFDELDDHQIAFI